MTYMTLIGNNVSFICYLVVKMEYKIDKSVIGFARVL